MSDYMYVVYDEEMDFAKITLPPYISAKTGSLGYGAREIALYTKGSRIEDGVNAILAVYPDAKPTALRLQAHEWLSDKWRHITPHKGGRTIKRSTDVTPETQRFLEALRESGISLGDLIEEAARQKYTELHK